SGAADSPTRVASITGPRSDNGLVHVTGFHSEGSGNTSNTCSHVVHEMVGRSRKAARPRCSRADHRTAFGVRLHSTIFRIRLGCRLAHQAHVRHTGLLQQHHGLVDASVVEI